MVIIRIEIKKTMYRKGKVSVVGMLNLLNGVGVGLPYLSFVSMNVERDGLNFEAL